MAGCDSTLALLWAAIVVVIVSKIIAMIYMPNLMDETKYMIMLLYNTPKMYICCVTKQIAFRCVYFLLWFFCCLVSDIYQFQEACPHRIFKLTDVFVYLFDYSIISTSLFLLLLD